LTISTFHPEHISAQETSPVPILVVTWNWSGWKVTGGSCVLHINSKCAANSLSKQCFRKSEVVVSILLMFEYDVDFVSDGMIMLINRCKNINTGVMMSRVQLSLPQQMLWDPLIHLDISSSSEALYSYTWSQNWWGTWKPSAWIHYAHNNSCFQWKSERSGYNRIIRTLRLHSGLPATYVHETESSSLTFRVTHLVVAIWWCSHYFIIGDKNLPNCAHLPEDTRHNPNILGFKQ
jgi:hypothetical protein